VAFGILVTPGKIEFLGGVRLDVERGIRLAEERLKSGLPRFFPGRSAGFGQVDFRD
jgi:hypothetical protein